MSLELSGTTGLKGVAGSVSAPSIVGDDTNSGISFPSADTIKFSTGGVERLSNTNSGLTGDGSGLTGVGGGKLLQVVQFTTHSTNNYSSVDFQNTVVTVNITPTAADSKFLISAVIHFGYQDPDTATSFNFSDSLHASGTTHPIAPMSGDGTNGAANSRLPAYFGLGSFANLSAYDDFFIGQVTQQFLYTPAYQNTNQRAFTVMVRSQLGRLVRFSMNGHLNSAEPKDMRPTNSITVMEIGA